MQTNNFPSAVALGHNLLVRLNKSLNIELGSTWMTGKRSMIYSEVRRLFTIGALVLVTCCAPIVGDVERLQVCEQTGIALSDIEVIDAAIEILISDLKEVKALNRCPLCLSPDLDEYSQAIQKSEGLDGTIDYYTVEQFRALNPGCCRFFRQELLNSWSSFSGFRQIMHDRHGRFVLPVRIQYQFKVGSDYDFRSTEIAMTPCGNRSNSSASGNIGTPLRN